MANENIVERPIVPYNPSTYVLNYRQRYDLFAPMASNGKIGMAGFNTDEFAVKNGVVHISEKFKMNLGHNLEDYYVQKDTIPSATESGPVKINGNHGLRMSGQFISVSPAERNDISDRTDLYKPLTPFNIDYAVKKSLSNNKLTGADSWNTSEKAAARALLGAAPAKETYESVQTITANGDSYEYVFVLLNYKKVLITYEVPPADYNGRVYILGPGDLYLSACGALNSAGKRYGWTEVDTTNGVYACRNIAAVTSLKEPLALYSTYYGGSGYPANNVGVLTISTKDKQLLFPAGTVITVKGIKL